MAEKKPAFVLKEGRSLEDIGIDWDGATVPCAVCVHEDFCLGSSETDEYFCEFIKSFEKLVNEFSEKVQKLVKEHGGA